MIAELKDHFKIILPALCLILFGTATVFSQRDVEEIEPVRYDNPERVSPEELYVPEHITKKPGHYTITDWQNAIDSTWGDGLPKAQKLQILDTFWNKIDQEFACFVNHPEYHAGWWDSLYTIYFDEINGGDPNYGVSRGRFAAIMNYLSMDLKEAHTLARDNYVSVQTALDPGVPLLVVGAYAENGHFGAGLTPLFDSSLLVFKAVPSHPLGLVPGDIVLGYDGVLWKNLYPQLLEAQLPICLGLGCWWGSSEESYNHSFLKTAGMNWHLFDTLDVIKYSTGDTVHLSVDPLIGQNLNLWCTEQMEIPGVPMPDYLFGDRATFGIISGTQIGYIYIASWFDDIEQQFYNAVNTLMNVYQTTGLIIDFRGSYGGGPHRANPGFKLLFSTKEPLYEFLHRCSPTDHLTMCVQDYGYLNYIYGSAKSYYDKPIAILTGPSALSASDINALALKSHPMTRYFGKATNGAYNLPTPFSLASGWFARNAYANTQLASDPGSYLTHSEIEVDEDVWLTPSDVAQGYDTVVEAAKSWINGQQSTQPEIAVDSTSLDITLDYGETTVETLTIENNGDRILYYSLTPEVDSGGTFVSSNLPTVTGHGGSDNYGYTWIDSDQPHGPSFNWVDISGIGTPVSLSNNSYAGPVSIGFNFPFYDSVYSELYIGSNGLISFGSGVVEQNNEAIPSSNVPNNFIAPWWDDLNPAMGGNVYYYHDSTNNRFIVSYVNVPKNYSGAFFNTTSFEVIIYSNGKIEFNYLDLGLDDDYIFQHFYSATVGIENSDGTDGLEIYYNAPYNVMDSLSIVINTDWLAISPYSSYIATGGNDAASITFSAKHLALGTFTGSIYLDSNDPVDSLIVIPVSLTVTGGCDFIVGDVNGPGSYNGLDITYGVNFFKYGSPPPQCPDCPLDDCNSWHYCGDVNGSCNYNGLDITYGVNYFKFGSPAPLPCPDCPPVE